MRYHLLYWNRSMTAIRMSMNVIQPEGLDRCLEVANRMILVNRFRYFIVSEEEYQLYWRDKVS
jgi:hypothetical protein